MTKHARNACSSAVFSAHERKQLNWGSKKVRLGKESIKDFDACCLCLKQAVDPVCSPEGNLFCKACIYSNLLTQKIEIKGRIKKWKRQQKQEDAQKQQEEIEKERATLEKFEQAAVESVLPTGKKVFVDASDNKPAKNKYVLEKGQDIGSAATFDRRTTSRDDVDERASHLACHWIPTLRASEHKTAKLSKPSEITLNPVNNRPLRMKQLRRVVFTNTLHDEKSTKKHLTGRYMCSSCRKQLTNATKVHVLSRCGHVVCQDCVDMFVLKDKCCPVCSTPHSKKYVIKLQMGGTGFVGSGTQTEAKAKLAPAFQC